MGVEEHVLIDPKGDSEDDVECDTEGKLINIDRDRGFDI